MPRLRRIIGALVEEARRRQCYKIILDCAEHNVEFYAKSGFVRKEVQMVRTTYRKDVCEQAGSRLFQMAALILLCP